MYENRPNYKLMQQKHVVCWCRYQNSCNWHERLRGHCQNSGFINNLASEVGVTRLWVPFYNEHATAIRMQHRTSRDCRNQSEYIVAKKLQQQQIHLKLLPVASYLSSLLFLLPRSSSFRVCHSCWQHARLQEHCRTFFLFVIHFCYILRTRVALTRTL